MTQRPVEDVEDREDMENPEDVRTSRPCVFQDNWGRTSGLRQEVLSTRLNPSHQDLQFFCRCPCPFSAVGRVFWLQPDGPGVGGHHVATAMDATGVYALIKLIGDNPQLSVLHDDVPRDGCQDPLAIFEPAGDHEDTRT